GNYQSAGARRAAMHHDSQNISGFPHAVAGNCEFTAISSVTRSHGTEAIMLSAMGLNVRRYNAGDKAPTSLGPREHSGTLDYMAKQKSSQARCRGVWPACGYLGTPHPDTPRGPDGLEREPARPGAMINGRRFQRAALPASTQDVSRGGERGWIGGASELSETSRNQDRTTT